MVYSSYGVKGRWLSSAESESLHGPIVINKEMKAMVDLTLTNLNQTLREFFMDDIEDRVVPWPMSYATEGEDVCLDCGKGIQEINGFWMHNDPDGTHKALPNQCWDKSSVLPDHPVLLAQNRQAFDTLYAALQEVRDIVHRGLRDGPKVHKRALQQAAKVLEVVE